MALVISLSRAKVLVYSCLSCSTPFYPVFGYFLLSMAFLSMRALNIVKRGYREMFYWFCGGVGLYLCCGILRLFGSTVICYNLTTIKISLLRYTEVFWNYSYFI